MEEKMETLYLGIVFLIIIGVLAFGRPLYQAILGGLAATVLLFRIPPVEIARRTSMVITGWPSLSVLLSLYMITFLQRILESRSQIKLAQKDLNGIFHNRRVNLVGACLFIGLLPSAASMILCSEIVKDSTDYYGEKAILPNFRKRKTLQSQKKITTLPKSCSVLSRTFLFALFFDFGNLLCRCGYNPYACIAHTVKKRVKLPPLRVLLRRRF